MRLLLVLVFAGSILGCGVRGRPLPPLDPPHIGDGRPPLGHQMDDPNMPPPLYGEDDDDEDSEDEESK